MSSNQTVTSASGHTDTNASKFIGVVKKCTDGLFHFHSVDMRKRASSQQSRGGRSDLIINNNNNKHEFIYVQTPFFSKCSCSPLPNFSARV